MYILIDELEVDVKFEDITPLVPYKPYNTIMGPVGFLPRLECEHSVVSLYHNVSGYIKRNEQLTNINGLGYMEKDYGISMPNWWIWLQAMNAKGQSFMISIANVPYLKMPFTGILGFFKDDNEQQIFASYNGTKVTKYIKEQNKVIITVENKKFKYSLVINYDKLLELKSPVNGKMNRDIMEGIDSNLSLIATNKLNQTFKEYYFNQVSVDIVDLPDIL